MSMDVYRDMSMCPCVVVGDLTTQDVQNSFLGKFEQSAPELLREVLVEKNCHLPRQTKGVVLEKIQFGPSLCGSQ